MAMLRRDFHYHLPGELIAQYPLACRTGSRMLLVDAQHGLLADEHLSALPDLLRPGDLLVFNDTRVMPARLFGRKDSGGRVEIFIERLLDDRSALVHLRASKPMRPGGRIELTQGVSVRVVERADDLYIIACDGNVPLGQIVEIHGHVPLPPYIERRPDAADVDRYQTVYARLPGSVAAPTAGLHFDKAFMDTLRARGVAFGFVTLHVGAGTFQPVRSERIEDHRMHAERVEVTAALCDQVAETRHRGGRVIAVGTTSVRALETASQTGEIRPYTGETRLFIYPGYEFKSVDAMITNFHLPESTLLMLVCAFAGRERIMGAYEHAARQGYRFLSYGDAMLIISPG